MNPPTGNNGQYGSYNPAPPSQESYMYSTPQQYYQHYGRSQPHPNNRGQQPNMMGTGDHQPFQQATAVMQQPGTGAFPDGGGGIQYFMDAACTVPAGSLPHQPQALSQFTPQQQQRMLMSQTASSSPAASLTKERPCVNPNCTHCFKGQTAPAGPNSRR